ncbi:MAG: hypothetical protein GXO88_11195 [Chlorobi bacterium]|nr:hypothetical protein [Chlorobiota bacterium]
MKKYFSEKQSAFATFFGGPLAGGLLVYKNLRTLDQKEKANIVLSVSFLLLIVSFVVVFNISDDKLARAVGSVTSATYALFAYYYHRIFLKKIVDGRIEEGEAKASNWTVALYSVGGIVITLTVAFIIGISQPAYPGSKIEFGETSNEIYYDKGNVNFEEIKKVAGILKISGYFGNDAQTSARLERENNVLVLKLMILQDYLEKAEIKDALQEMHKSLELNLNCKAKIIAEYYDLGGNLHQKIF